MASTSTQVASLERELDRLREDHRAARETNATLCVTVDSLRSVIASLESELSAQRAAFEDQTAALEKALEKLEYLQKRFLGVKKSEKKPKVPSPESHARSKQPPSVDPEAAKHKRAARKKKRAEVETKRVFHPVPDAARTCPKCSHDELKRLGKGRATKRWEYVPGRFICYEDVQEKLRCPCGEYVVTAPPPPRPFEGCQYGPRFIAHIIVSKLWDAIPIHRLEKRFERLGIPMSRSTMNDLVHRIAAELEPLIAQLTALVAAAPVVLADETSIKLQDRDKRGFVWTFVTPEAVVYRLSGDRSGQTPQDVLGGSEGLLLVDGYTGYNKIIGVDGRACGRCNAHARRKFFEAKEQAPDFVDEMLDLYSEVYAVERRAKEGGFAGTEAHLELRASESRHAMELLHERLLDEALLHPPRSKLGKAIGYALKHWKGLTLFLEHPDLPIDNNGAESALRKIALGRNNWLFFGHQVAGENLVGLMSLVASCMANDKNPEEYLADVIMRLAEHPHAQIEDLLPHRWMPP